VIDSQEYSERRFSWGSIQPANSATFIAIKAITCFFRSIDQSLSAHAHPRMIGGIIFDPGNPAFVVNFVSATHQVGDDKKSPPQRW